MEILGHSQIALTMNTYSPVAPEVSRTAADRMAELLWQDGQDHAEEIGAVESDNGQDEGEYRPLLLALLLGWYIGWQVVYRWWR